MQRRMEGTKEEREKARKEGSRGMQERLKDFQYHPSESASCFRLSGVTQHFNRNVSMYVPHHGVPRHSRR